MLKKEGIIYHYDGGASKANRTKPHHDKHIFSARRMPRLIIKTIEEVLTGGEGEGFVYTATADNRGGVKVGFSVDVEKRLKSICGHNVGLNRAALVKERKESRNSFTKRWTIYAESFRVLTTTRLENTSSGSSLLWRSTLR